MFLINLVRLFLLITWTRKHEHCSYVLSGYFQSYTKYFYAFALRTYFSDQRTFTVHYQYLLVWLLESRTAVSRMEDSVLHPAGTETMVLSVLVWISPDREDWQGPGAHAPIIAHNGFWLTSLNQHVLLDLLFRVGRITANGWRVLEYHTARMEYISAIIPRGEGLRFVYTAIFCCVRLYQESRVSSWFLSIRNLKGTIWWKLRIISNLITT